MISSSSSLEKGSKLTGPVRVMTAERLRWYGDGFLTSAAGKPVQVGSTIHTDSKSAQAEGFPEVIADGLLGGNWLAEMLLNYFGQYYVMSSRLRIKFIKPVFIGDLLVAQGVVSEIVNDANGATYHIDLAITDEHGSPRTVGEAFVMVPSMSSQD